MAHRAHYLGARKGRGYCTAAVQRGHASHSFGAAHSGSVRSPTQRGVSGVYNSEPHPAPCARRFALEPAHRYCADQDLSM